MALTTERSRVAHLLRRATFGAGVAEIDAAARDGLQATIDRLLHPERRDEDVESTVPRSVFDFTKGVDAVRWWTLRMRYARRQFQEKLTFFWHGHLTSALSRTGGRPEYMVSQIDTYRDLALGGFRDLVVASAKSAAMIRWLDNNQNRKGKPNENYARELMELFTLGIGAYSEQDIREAARAFTGWFERNGEFYFVAQQHDTGAKTVLGHTGSWNGDDVIDILVRQPACARFIAGKLWRFFAYPEPEPEVVDAIAAAFTGSGYSIRETMRAIFTHPAFYSDRAYHALVKSPLDFMLGFLRSLDGKTDGVGLQLFLGLTGHVPLNPPTVEGWPGGREWISTTALLARYNLVSALLRPGTDQPTHVDVAGLLRSRGIAAADEMLDFFIDLMLDGDLSPAKRKILADYLVAQDNDRSGPFTLDERTVNNKVRGLIHLIATTPEYQMY
ncbi:MAG: DUF1800 domain-containing protein [Dehalococcoidia bacterium]